MSKKPTDWVANMLSETAEAERQSMSRRKQLSLLSHDLRSALSDVIGGLSLIDTSDLSPDSGESLDRVSAAARHLARLLEELLDERALAANETPARAVNVNLSDFLGDLDKRWGAKARSGNIGFRIDCANALPAIVTLDRISLERIVSNLVGNAIKFSEQGQVELSVFCDQDNALCFRVRDEGPGMSAEAIAHLYEFGGRPEKAEKPGSGLGLFIAKDLSDLLGGSLEILNRTDKSGVEATFCVPHDAWFDRRLRRDGKPEGDDIIDEIVDLTGLRILLAEDNKTNQLVASQMLGSMGAEYSIASDGLEALEILKAETFDLALIDIEMPRMSGLELLKTVRAMPTEVSKMPMVALTAYVMQEHRARILEAGADGIIAKPLMSVEDLGRGVLEFYQASKKIAADRPNPVENPIADDDVIDRGVFDKLVATIGAASTSELMEKLIADTDAVAEGLGRGRRNLDLAEIRSQTHILVSVAGAIGARRLQALAQELNAAANREEASPKIDERCEQCLSGLAALQAFIMDQQTKSPPDA